MSIIKKVLFLSIFISIVFVSKTVAEDLKKVGKFKDWETIILTESTGKVCYAQSTPVLQSPKKKQEKCKAVYIF